MARDRKLFVGSLIALFVVALVLVLSGCSPTYSYDAEPIDGKERCFNIERENDMDEDEVNLGTFCKHFPPLNGEGDD
jgi:hypothetical protein